MAERIKLLFLRSMRIGSKMNYPSNFILNFFDRRLLSINFGNHFELNEGVKGGALIRWTRIFGLFFRYSIFKFCFRVLIFFFGTWIEIEFQKDRIDELYILL